MCCFKQRKTPARIVMVLSAIIFLCSILILVLSVRFYRSELFQSSGELQAWTASKFYTLVSFSIMAFLVSIGGILSAYFKQQRWPVVVFGILLTVICFMFISSGIGMATLAATSGHDMEQFCENPIRENPNDSKFRTYIY